MKIIKVFLLLLIISAHSSCVILTVKQYETQKKEQSLNDMKSAVHHLLIDQNLRNDTTDLSSLLRLISTNNRYLSTKKIDDRRIELITFDLIRTYSDYWNKDAPFSFKMTERELESKVSCYLNYILNSDNEYVRFWIFWKKDAYQKFRCDANRLIEQRLHYSDFVSEFILITET